MDHGLLSRISFLRVQGPPHKFPRWSSILRRNSYEKLPERRKTRERKKERKKEEEKVVPSSSLSFPRNFLKGGERGKIHPPLKRVYTSPTHLLASICKSNLLSFNHRLLDGSVKGWARASASSFVLTIDRIKSLSSRRTPPNLHEPSISTNEKPWSNTREEKEEEDRV